MNNSKLKCCSSLWKKKTTDTYSDGEHTQENEETKTPQDKDYSISKERNGKLIKRYFGDDADTTKKTKIKSDLLKKNRRIILADMKKTFNTTTKRTEFEFGDLIMMLANKNQLEDLQEKVTEFYKSNNFEVRDPKPVTGGKKIDIDEHTTSKDKKDIKSKYLTIYFYTKENKIMVQGSDSNLQAFIDNYLYNFISSLPVAHNKPDTTKEKEKDVITAKNNGADSLSTNITENTTHFNKDLITLERSNNDSKTLSDYYCDTFSDFSDKESELSDVSLITESDLKFLENKFERRIWELQQIIETQNVNHKDLEVQFQNKLKQQNKEFLDKLIQLEETFDRETTFLETEFKKLSNECIFLKNQLRQAQKEINSIDMQLKQSPPASSFEHKTSLKFPPASSFLISLPNMQNSAQMTDRRKPSHDNHQETAHIIPCHENRFSTDFLWIEKKQVRKTKMRLHS